MLARLTKVRDMCYHFGINIPNPMTEEYLSRCVVDPMKRKIFLYSSEGDEKVVSCETMDQFMNLLEMCRNNLDEDTLAYADPL